MTINPYSYLYHNPKEMDDWHWFLQKGDWVKEVKDEEEVKELVGKRSGFVTQWVVTHSGEAYDTIQLEAMMCIDDGSVLYGALGNPDCDLYEPVEFPSSLDLPTQKAQEGDDNWLPFDIEVAGIMGYIM